MTTTTTKNWVSNQGETFNGTQAELMKAKGIKHRMGFSRPSGAVDSDGDRWLEDDGNVVFTKPKLYLGGHYDRKCKVWEEPSSTATNYLTCMLYYDGDTEFALGMMRAIEAQYEIIDNRKHADTNMAYGKKGRAPINTRYHSAELLDSAAIEALIRDM